MVRQFSGYFRISSNLTSSRHSGWLNSYSTVVSNEKPHPEEKSPETETKTNNQEELSAVLKTVQEKNAELIEQIKEIDDKYKRALAENENIRMRMKKQIEDAKQFGIQNFCKDLLDVADVLSKATECVPKEALTQDNQHLMNLYQGLQATEAQLQNVFRRHGLTKINPLGEKFDPNQHEAVFQQDDPSKEPGTVFIVNKIGYKLFERTIRPASVGIIKTP